MTDDVKRYELMMETFAELQSEIGSAHTARPIHSQPSLDQVLDGFGPMPDEALFLGVASDELPVLLNLHDPVPGPLLVVGEPGTGKTGLLQVIARAAEKMHQPGNLQFGVLTSHPDEWNGFEKVPNAVGIFSVHHRSSEDFILSLASWAHGNKSSRQSVLLLLDDLETVAEMDMDAVQNLRWLLLRGPSRRVWPIITLSTKSVQKMEPWLAAFRTRIMGRIDDAGIIQILGASQADLESMEKRSGFTLREGSRWLRFWVPALDE